MCKTPGHKWAWPLFAISSLDFAWSTARHSLDSAYEGVLSSEASAPLQGFSAVCWCTPASRAHLTTDASAIVFNRCAEAGQPVLRRSTLSDEAHHAPVFH